MNKTPDIEWILDGQVDSCKRCIEVKIQHESLLGKECVCNLRFGYALYLVFFADKIAAVPISEILTHILAYTYSLIELIDVHLLRENHFVVFLWGKAYVLLC